jgi:hypothetical protein
MDSNGYDSDEILSQALDLFEEKEGERIFITQNTYRLVQVTLSVCLSVRPLDLTPVLNRMSIIHTFIVH